jgi:adenylate cyclase
MGCRTPFIQQFGPGDRVAYRTASTLLTGRAHLDEDRLCLRYEDYFLDRTFCGEVYRNPTGNAESRYVSISPDALRFFSTKDESVSRP